MCKSVQFYLNIPLILVLSFWQPCIYFIFVQGMTAYDRLNSLLTSTRLVNDIKQLSSDAQTSCLESLHATLNHWHPKMVCFLWLETFCRWVWNSNLLQSLSILLYFVYHITTYLDFWTTGNNSSPVAVVHLKNYGQQLFVDVFFVPVVFKESNVANVYVHSGIKRIP